VLRGHAKSVASIAFFPDGEQCASVAMDNSLILWDLKSGHSTATLWGGAEESFASVAVYAQGHQIACGMTDGRIRLWVASA
jgi:WD40 repeat protein